ncbi:MAG: Outer membrane protein assembly factor BamA precursor [Candidatus Dependentiae bacterium ADurb.Bin331]|nr:MAG: Outer membrane protein assembly factor BamA precursor [Candidatus Dependentiae bacterium ADurb.Bin331]
MMSARSTGLLVLILTFFLSACISLNLFAMDVASMPAQSDDAVQSTDQDDSDDVDYEEDDDELDQEYDAANYAPKLGRINLSERIVHSISVEGNNTVPAAAIINRVPFRVGQPFDQRKSTLVIKNINDLGYFNNVELFGEPVGDDQVDLIVVVSEKTKLSGVEFVGNNHLAEKEIAKKIDFTKVATIDENDLPRYIGIIKKLYRDKDYHNAQVTAKIVREDGAARLIISIQENNKTLVKQVRFSGNEAFTGKKLRSMLFTREDWIGGFLDHAGSYQPEMLEADKQVIENYYQSNGYLQARVIDTQVQADPTGEQLKITYNIQEGAQYTISEVSVPGNDLVSEEFLRERIPVKVGDLYSKEKIRETIEALRLMWGEFGYIYADIEPSIQPDDLNKTVKIGFYSELGPQVYLESITIRGNEKTEDKIIRRQLSLVEGGLLTTKGMEDSKNRVELLGYFDQRGGVNWKINRIGKDRADLELLLREVKTGRAELNVGFGGSQRDASSPIESLSIRGSLSDTNFLGQGIAVAVSAQYAKREVDFNFNVTQPWLFDRPIHAGIDIFTKRTSYDEFFFLAKRIHERIAGGAFNLGFLVRRVYDSLWLSRFIVEEVHYTNTAVEQTNLLTIDERVELQGIINRRFQSGTFVAWALNITKDERNHPMHPSRGYQWQILSKVALPSHAHDFGFFKTDIDASWYTPLIGERQLIFAMHGHLGLIAPFKNKTVPFRELYNMGGPATVRGFEFGEIGPQWVVPRFPDRSNPLGATRAFWINTELVFPISADFSMKGCVFYDGGAGWRTIDADEISPVNLRNNHFSYRHSVGIGLRVLRPTPMKIDWGFKLDRRKGEKATMVHFSAYHEF